MFFSFLKHSSLLSAFGTLHPEMGKLTKLSFAMTEQIGWEVITLAGVSVLFIKTL